MSHIPINHPLRPLYRTLSVLTGLFILVFGIIGAVNTNGDPVFEQDKIERVFGLRTNFAFSVLSIAAGAVLVLATVIGRNLDKWVYLLGGIVFMVVGLGELALMGTDLNYFAFAMTNVIVSMVIGSILFTAGLYGKSGTSEEAHAEESFRHEHAVAA
jgi:Domain of unknown function (DUF4383)